MDRWFVVARSEEAVARHVLESKILGQDIALWRDDAGLINAWANRCPHRGVRLSIGFNTGMELRCQYHGWRFASGGGQCSFIPSHPTQKPASTLHATVYGVAERHGFIWARLAGQDGAPPALPPGTADSANPGLTLRSMFMHAPLDKVAARLMQAPGLDGSQAAAILHDPYTVSTGASGGGQLIFFLQPVADRESAVHGLLLARVAAAERIRTLRHYNAKLTAIRNALESGA